MTGALTASLMRHMQPDRRAPGKGADLHQVTQVIGEPEASRRRCVAARLLTIGQGPIEQPVVANLTDELCSILPHAKPACAGSVKQRIGRHLVDRDNQIPGPRSGHSGCQGMSKDYLSNRGQVRLAEDEFINPVVIRLWQRLAERIAAGLNASEDLAWV